jgi:SAM-dependent methyltransferase
MTEPEYLMINARAEAADRLDGLAEAFDGATTGHLRRLGVRPGASCLEVGAGGGSIARWLAAQVGPGGRVLATDLDPSRFRHDGSPQLEVRQHDLVEEPVPEGPWDVVHERLVLQHLSQREEILARLVASLAPAGWILLEDFDAGIARTADRWAPGHELVQAVATTFREILVARGAVNDFSDSARRLLGELGLTDIGSSGHVAIDPGGQGWARAMSANARQTRDQLHDRGVSLLDVDRYLELVEEPERFIASPVLVSTWGRQPGPG